LAGWLKRGVKADAVAVEILNLGRPADPGRELRDLFEQFGSGRQSAFDDRVELPVAAEIDDGPIAGGLACQPWAVNLDERAGDRRGLALGKHGESGKAFVGREPDLKYLLVEPRGAGEVANGKFKPDYGVGIAGSLGCGGAGFGHGLEHSFAEGLGHDWSPEAGVTPTKTMLRYPC